MVVLVIGGAGYIGSHTTYELIRSGYDVIVYDNLSTGHLKAIHPQATFIEGDIHDVKKLERIMKQNKVKCVMHFAAKIVVSESVENPLDYYDNNVYGTQNLLVAMKHAGVKNIVFSSTAATYGNPMKQKALTEDAETNPINPYGETKIAAEKMIYWSANAYDLRYIIFRYFNVAGADESGEIGLSSSKITHLVPSITEAALKLRPVISIYGTDYQTQDGTCIRDYIHVSDLARAHVLAAKHLLLAKKSQLLNLGSEKGFSVQQVVETAKNCLPTPFAVEYKTRRIGDPDFLVASYSKAKLLLNWEPTHSLEEMMMSDYRWRKKARY